MIPQNQLSNRHSQTHARLLYTAPYNSLETDNQLLQLYLKDLIFQGSVDGMQQLNNEEVEELKRIFSLLFEKYEMGLLSLAEIEGLWPFMHFAFPNISGIQLYLYFEYLLTPAPFEPARSPDVKEEYVSFNPQKYFQESRWKDHKKFMRSIRVLQRTLKKKSIEDNIEACQNALQLVVMNGQQFLIAAKQFKTQFIAFKERIKGVSVVTVMNLDQLFNERMIEERCIESQPDFIHIIHSFTKEEYFQRHNTKTKTMIEMAPIKEEEQAENPLQQNQDEYYQETISARGNARHAQSQMRSLPTKRRLETEKTTLRRRQIKRTPRKKVIQALFKKRQKQNIIVKDLIQNRKVKERKAKEARRLEKIKKRICYSDDEEQNTTRRKKRAKRLSNPKMHIQSQYESRYSHSNHKEQQYFSDDSEEIQIKRNRNVYRKQVVLNQIQNNFEYSNNRNSWKRDSEEQMMVIQETLIQSKLDKYGIGKIKTSQPRVVRSEQKLENIYIRKIRLAEDGHMPITFHFAEYMRYLEVLTGNEVEKQAKAIAKEVVARLDIQYDVNLALKIMAAQVVGKRNASTNWINAVNNYIEPLLKFTIGVNFYRTVSNILNDFFACNDDLAALNKAKIYFNILFQVGKSYAQKGLEVIIMEIIYNFMITPKKYNTVSHQQYFYPQCSSVFLSHPFKIADSELKMNLEPTEASIAFSTGCLAFEALYIWSVADHSDVFIKKQKAFFDSFKNELNGLDHNWPFHTLSKVLKSFYTSYQPSLTFDYFIRLVSIISFSLDKIILSALAQTSIDPKEHVQFLLEIIDKFIQTELSQTTTPPVKNLLSKIIMQTNLKQKFGNQRGNKYRTMLYASVLDLIIQKPFFRRNYSQVRGDFIKYVNELKSQLPEIVSSLKANIYQPIFSLISQTYEIEIQKQLIMGNDAGKMYEETRNVITCLWECLDKEYSKQSQRLNDHLNSKVPSKLSQLQRAFQTKRIKDQFKKCEDLFQLFLAYFVPINDQSNLSLSTSHNSFVLELILKQQFFIKYFENKICNNGQGNLTQKFVEVLNTYLHSSIHNQKKQIQMFSEHPNPMKKDVQHKILKETSDQSILDVFSTINWVYMIAAIQKFKTKQVSPPDNTILKMVSDSVGHVSTNYSNIAKATNLYNLYLRKLMIYICEKEDFVRKRQIQEAELVKTKSFVWNHLTGNGKLKEIVLLIVLSSATRNCFEYERIPWSDLLYSIKRLNLLNDKNLKTSKDIGYLAFLYNIQNIENYNSIADIFSKVLHFRSTLNKEDSSSLTKGIEAMLMDVFAILKKLQLTERDKEPITLLCLQILSFLLQWPQILPQCINKFWKDMQVISKAECMITKLKMNDRNVEILMRFFYLLDFRKENPYQIKDTMGIFVQKMAAHDNNIRKEQYFKRVRKLLVSTRECCKRDINLQRIAYPFLKDFLNRFCAPQKLLSEHYSTWMQRLQIYLEMMRDSVYERKAYEQLLIDNRKKYQEMLFRNKGFKVQYHTQQEHYLTLQQLIMSCMIHRHSDLYDIKRLLGAMKKQALLKAQTKEVYRSLFGKLKIYAQEMIKQDIVEWTKDQLKDLQQMGNIQDWMDLQSD